jgi:RHS repeat-associated protein
MNTASAAQDLITRKPPRRPFYPLQTQCPWAFSWSAPDQSLQNRMHFRFYGSNMGRFMKPDNISGNMANPQSWNLYSYVHGNPVNFNDPTGHMVGVAWRYYTWAGGDIAGSMGIHQEANAWGGGLGLGQHPFDSNPQGVIDWGIIDNVKKYPNVWPEIYAAMRAGAMSGVTAGGTPYAVSAAASPACGRTTLPILPGAPVRQTQYAPYEERLWNIVDSSGLIECGFSLSALNCYKEVSGECNRVIFEIGPAWGIYFWGHYHPPQGTPCSGSQLDFGPSECDERFYIQAYQAGVPNGVVLQSQGSQLYLFELTNMGGQYAWIQHAF